MSAFGKKAAAKAGDLDAQFALLQKQKKEIAELKADAELQCHVLAEQMKRNAEVAALILNEARKVASEVEVYRNTTVCESNSFLWRVDVAAEALEKLLHSQQERIATAHAEVAAATPPQPPVAGFKAALASKNKKKTKQAKTRAYTRHPERIKKLNEQMSKEVFATDEERAIRRKAIYAQIVREEMGA